MVDSAVSSDSDGGVAAAPHRDRGHGVRVPDVWVPVPETVPSVIPASGPTCGGSVEINRSRCGVTVIGMAGEIDLASAPDLERAVLAAVAATPGHRIIIDLNRVEFFGACAISLLLAADTHARRDGGQLHLVVDDVAPAARALHCVPELDIPIIPTLTAAMTSTRSPSMSGEVARGGAAGS